MNITRTIKLDLAKQDSPIQLGYLAVAGDSPCRSLRFELFEAGVPWVVPEGVHPIATFSTSNGCTGRYDTLPTGESAVEVQENVVTVRLLDQMMAEAGNGRMQLILMDQLLNTVSSFHVSYLIETGLGNGEMLPKEYYSVSSLSDLNETLEKLTEQVDALDTEEIRRAAQEARLAADQAVDAAKTVNADELNTRIDGKGDHLLVQDGRLYLCSWDQEQELSMVELPESASGLSFDSGFVDEAGMLHLTKGGVEIEGFIPFFVGTGGGASSRMVLATDMVSREFSILEQDESCEIRYSWSSTDVVSQEPTGDGSAEWSVGGSRVAVQTVKQGDNVFDIRKYLTSGAENSVVLKVTDAHGSSRTLTFAVTVTSFGLSWNLGETGIYGSMGLNLRLVATGTGDKTVKVSVDETVISETLVSTTGRTTTVTVPVQGHGAHTIKAWVEAEVDGVPLRTDPLIHTGAWMRSGITTPVVAVLTPEIIVGQYGSAAVRFFVVDPEAETATVVLKVGQETVRVLENVDRSVQTWYYKTGTVGQMDLHMECGSAVGNVCLTVSGLGYQIAPVTAGLELDLDPAGHSNAEVGRQNFGYTDAEGVNHPLIFSENFDWTNGGFRTDDEGVTALVIRKGCSVALDRSIFDVNPRLAGRHIKLVFKSDNVRNYDAQLMSCKSGSVGIAVQAQQTIVSSELETMQVLYCEDRKIEMDICIQAENEGSLAWIDMKAIQSCPPVRYGSTDNWVQGNAEPLVIGSDEADVWIYRMKVYSNSLNRYEVLDNFIADSGSPAEMVARYERNDVFNSDGTLNLGMVSLRNPGLRVIHLKADRMTTGKSDEVPADFEMLYRDGGEKHHLIARDIRFKAQGTSSLEYILAALNLDVDLSCASSFTNGLGEAVTGYAFHDNAIPVDYFNLKANVASSESANNICLADDYNTFDPYVCAPKKADPRVRDTVEGHPCAVFFTNTAEGAIEVGARTVQPGETILYFAGDMNNSKKNFAVFGQDNAKWPRQCCVEVMNNTEKPCRFLENVGDDETWKDGNFEFRFPKNPTEEMKDSFRTMHAWVVSCAASLATNDAFSVPVTINGIAYAGDTREYRGAKFCAEFETYFVKDQMLFHRLFTDDNCMTDNNAKNLFFCYEYIEELEDYRWSVRCDYDNDTGLGNDNSGGLTFTYGLELHDMVGDSYVFNAHDSALWSNMDEFMTEDLTAMRISLVGTGVWDPDRKSAKFREYQAITPEAVRIEDMHSKYFVPWIHKDAAAYSRKCYGTKEEQREQFLQYQSVYKSTQYIDVTNRSDAISMRVTVDQAENGDMTITAYCDMYIVVMYGNGGRAAVRVKRNTPTLIQCPTDSLGDTETYIFAASHLTHISSLAGMKPKFVLATTAKRLRQLIVGSGEAGYRNLNLNQIGVGNNEMLEVLNVQGCPNLTTALDLSGLKSLEEFLANGSGITGVTFAQGAPLETARIPAVSSFVGQDLTKIADFLLDGRELLSLRIENCPGMDTLAICKSAPKLARGRLTDVNWTDDNADVLVKLAKLGGLDAQGKVMERFVLTGKCHVGAAMQSEIDAIQAAFPDLTLTVGSVVEGYTVTFHNFDGTEYPEARQIIRLGGDAVDPVAAGLMNAPVRPSNVEYLYTYIGWSGNFRNITADTRIIAQYSQEERYYRVTYWDDAAENLKLQEEMVIAHGASPYQGPEPQDGETMWMGWDAQADDVICDLDIHSVRIIPVLPAGMPVEFDYLYSDDPNDVSAFSLAEFAGILTLGDPRTYFQVGDRIRMIVPRNDVLVDEDFILSLEAFDHFRLSDGTGFASTVFGMVGTTNSDVRMYSVSDNTGGWALSDLRALLNETVFPLLPAHWRKLIRTVQVRSSEGGQRGSISWSDDQLFVRSAAEMGFHATLAPYSEEVDPEAEEVTFRCYTDSASRIKKTFNGTGAASMYWIRSPRADTTDKWLLINGVGNCGDTLGPASLMKISFCFCV